MKSTLFFSVFLNVVGSVVAEQVILETRLPGGGVTPCPTYCELSGTWYNSIGFGTAPGIHGAGSRFSTTPGASFSISPFLNTNCEYRLEVTHECVNASADIVVGVQVSGGAIDTNTTVVFQQSQGCNQWAYLGKLVPSTSQPTITFTHVSGSPNRFYADAFRFTSMCPPPPTLTSVHGPLVAGQTYVDVPGVAAGVTKVTVYARATANLEKIGEITSGVVAGVNRVPTLPLSRGQEILPTQRTDAGESFTAPIGPVVGGGATPAVRILLGVRETRATNGVIGEAGTLLTGPVKYISATGMLSTMGRPQGGKLIQPSDGWQTVTFDRATDPIFDWSDSIPANTLDGDFGVLDSLAFCFADDRDSGPYAVYIDDLANGMTLIEAFENATNGEPEVLLSKPSYSTVTRNYLNECAPDVSEAREGVSGCTGKCLFLNWQFRSVGYDSWLYVPFVSHPVIDLRQPISFQILLTRNPGTLRISRFDTHAVMHWIGCFRLQSATNINSIFTDVTGVSTNGPYTNACSDQQRFFRLRN